MSDLLNTIIIVAICAVTVLESFAIFMQQDGVYFGAVIAAISALAGFYGGKKLTSAPPAK